MCSCVTLCSLLHSALLSFAEASLGIALLSSDVCRHLVCFCAMPCMLIALLYRLIALLYRLIAYYDTLSFAETSLGIALLSTFAGAWCALTQCLVCLLHCFIGLFCLSPRRVQVQLCYRAMFAGTWCALTQCIVGYLHTDFIFRRGKVKGYSLQAHFLLLYLSPNRGQGLLLGQRIGLAFVFAVPVFVLCCHSECFPALKWIDTKLARVCIYSFNSVIEYFIDSFSCLLYVVRLTFWQSSQLSSVDTLRCEDCTWADKTLWLSLQLVSSE